MLITGEQHGIGQELVNQTNSPRSLDYCAIAITTYFVQDV